MHQFVCPHCGQQFEAEGLAIGQSWPCPACGKSSWVANESSRLRHTIYLLLGLAGFLALSTLVVVVAPYVRSAGGDSRSDSSGKGVPEWIEQLERGKTAELRREAAAALVAAGPAAVANSLDAVLKIGDDQGGLSINSPAMRALVEVGPDAVAPLREALTSNKANVRVAAAMALRDIGPPAKGAVTALGAALADENRWVRWYAADALGNMGPEAAPAIELLRQAAGHTDRYTRRRALAALGQIGPAAAVAAPLLGKIQQDDDDAAVRDAALAALFQIDLPRLASNWEAKATDDVRELIVKLRKGDESDSVSAANTLGKMGLRAGDAVPSLALALQDHRKWVRVAAAESLGKLGQQARPAAFALQKAAAEEDPDLRAAAETALQKIQAKKPRE